MSDIKQKAREMFDDKFKGIPFRKLLIQYENDQVFIIETQKKLQSFLDQIIDLAIAERDKEVVEMIEKLTSVSSTGETGSFDSFVAKEDIINRITNSNK